MQISNRVKVYTSPICTYCHTLKEFLKEKNIIFEEIDIAENEEARDYIIEKTGKMEAPIMEIDGEVVVGFDKEKISKLLNIKG